MQEEIRNYIYREILEEETGIDENTPLYSSSLISSMGHLKLINFLERKYDIAIPMQKIRMDNFDTINQICLFIQTIQKSAAN